MGFVFTLLIFKKLIKHGFQIKTFWLQWTVLYSTVLFIRSLLVSLLRRTFTTMELFLI